MNDGNGALETVDGRQARVMELAQQQQVALERLEGIVENQQRVREMLADRNNNDDDDDASGQQQEEEEEEEGRLMADMNIPPLQNNNRTTQEQQRLNRQGRHMGGARYLYSICTVQLYFMISVLFALLAVVTSPSNELFESIKVIYPNTAEVNNQVHHAVDAFKANVRKLEDGIVAVDGQGNVIDKGTKKGGGWDAVVAHNSKSNHSPTVQLSWFETYIKTTWEVALLLDDSLRTLIRDHFVEQYEVLQRLKFHLMQYPLLEKTASPTKLTAAATDIKQSSSQPTRWLPPWEWMKQKRGSDGNSEETADVEQSSNKNKALIAGNINKIKLHPHLSPLLGMIYPTLLEKFEFIKGGGSTDSENTWDATFMTIVDKIFTSTPRLLAVANLLLAVAYLLQTAVADIFLGPVNTSNNDNATGQIRTNLPPTDEATRRRRAGRERFGGFLLFKLLLISSVLEPDSVDLFILLIWYTALSFLRSLSHLAGTTSSHASQSGEPPSKGALRLLILVLVCDVSAAVGMVTVFHSIGPNMLILLTCDCYLVGIDAVTNIVKYLGLATEEAHRHQISQLEERQLELHARRREQARGSDDVLGARDSETEDDGSAFEDELTALDREVQVDEALRTARMSAIDKSVFLLELCILFVTIAHFIHIWSVHGTSFGLVDGVLALHLQSSISLVGRKISERRNVHRISREINSHFPDAKDIDIRKSSANGDVCCICLNSLLVGGVKKVPCGHLFHTQCLRQVLERERTFAIAKCPLCRASLLTGTHERNEPQVAGGVGNDATDAPDNRQGQQPNQQLNPGVEHSLLRFSTENLLPAWLPVPAFAFEVVRRETVVAVEPNNNTEGGGWWQRFFRRGGQVQVEVVGDIQENDDQAQLPEQQPQPQQQQQQPPHQEPSFWRQLLVLLGAIPLTPEQEAAALEQLVDMFPQYDRADLLRELRARRSAEAVAESILLGLFQGIPRGVAME